MDVDVAEEVTNYAKYSVQVYAASAALAQSNLNMGMFVYSLADPIVPVFIWRGHSYILITMSDSPGRLDFNHIEIFQILIAISDHYNKLFN